MGYVTTQTRVLVVDDDPLIRFGTAVMLSELGFAPLIASDAEDAIAMVGEQGDVEILVTDYDMPHFNGLELATMISAVRPGTRVLVVSGFGGLEERLEPDWQLLPKPFTAEELCAALARMVPHDS